MQALIQDLRFAFRQLRKRLGFTFMAVATLALGIGSATAVFSLVDTILLHPLPFPQPDRIISVQTLEQPRGHAAGVPATIPDDTSYPTFRDWRDQSHSFAALASWGAVNFTLGNTGGPARRIDGLTVSSGFLDVLGVTPTLGRNFLRAEEQAGHRSVLISHSLWQSALEASPNVIGRTLQLNDEAYTVIGVLPSGFAFPASPNVSAFVTSAAAMEGKDPSGNERGWTQVEVIGRLAPGVSLAQAAAEMQVIERGLSARYPEDMANQTAVAIRPLLDDLTATIQGPLRILFAAVSLLLLIACANVAGLLLTRSAARRPELALRSAIGASRWQIIRQLLVESLTLSTLGGLAGFALAAVTLQFASSFLPATLPRLNELQLNFRVLLFALAASFATGLLFGVYPAWRSSRTNPANALRDSTRSSFSGRGQQRLHGALVIGETALSLMLLVGAGLLIRSFTQLMHTDPGFEPRHLITFRVGMPPKRFTSEKLLQLSNQLQTRFAAIPGVESSTYAFPIPLSGGDIRITFDIEGQPTAPGNAPTARLTLASANLFSTLKVPLRHGRFFTDSETSANGPRAVLVNQAFADRFFPGQDAVGRHISPGMHAGDQPELREIVGVLGNVTRGTLTEPAAPEYFLPFTQIALSPPSFALRVAGEPATYEQSVRAAVAEIDPSLPVYAVRTNLLALSTAQQRFQTQLISAFALIALVLAAIGLYAVLSYMVAQRTSELGLRMALGASRANVLSLILNRGLLLCCTGLAIGLAASAMLARFLASILFHVPALDLPAFLGASLLLLGISLAACLLPAARAARLEPMQALQS